MRASAVSPLAYPLRNVEKSVFVDTNVWKCLTYSKATISYRATAASYADFIRDCRRDDVELLNSPLSFSEMASLIEKTEYEIYKGLHKATISVKQFRRGTTERASVVGEVTAAWSQIEALSVSIPLQLDRPTFSAAQNNFSNFELDGYDIFFVEQMSAANVHCIVTHDIDFLSVPGIHIFTANHESLKIAQLYKRLVQ